MRVEQGSTPQGGAGLGRSFLSRPGVRQAVKVSLDAGSSALAWIAAFSLIRLDLPGILSTLAWVAFSMAVNGVFKLTRQHYRMMGFLEIKSLLVSLVTMIVLAAACYPLEGRYRLGIEYSNVTLVAGLFTAFTWVLIRAASVDFFRRRFLKDHPHRPTVDRRKTPRQGSSPIDDLALRTLIVGAGEAGAQLCHELRTNPSLKSRAVGFVDDALEKQGVRIHGLPVLGPTELLPALIRESGASQVILAMPSAPGTRIRELARVLQEEGVRVKTLPSLQYILEKGGGWKPELRDIAIEDLLRREPIQLDMAAIRQQLEGSVVLITGAGGSIGSELARQVANFKPARLILLGRGENSLWEVERELKRTFPGQAMEVELCDIRNPRRLQQAFHTWRPQHVFHAAAHKHVPYLEQHPEEGFENNVLGTLNVLKAAESVHVKTFVNVSTDKAVNPTSVLGATKRIAEFLVLRTAEETAGDGRYVSVRFGNVLGSRGSVIPLFHDQIRHGGPLTVTHPDMTRYFMTIPEASQLVLQAGILGQNGKVFVLDMGDPVRIADLAKDMAHLSGLTLGFDIDIQYTGLRPGEKLFEELFTKQEQGRSDVHAKVFQALQESKNPAVLDRLIRVLQEAVQLGDGARQEAMVRGFLDLVPTYHPSPLGLGKFLPPAEPEPQPATAAYGPTHPVLALRPSGPLTQFHTP